MSVPYIAMPIYMRLVTRWTPPKIAEIEKGLMDGSLHPRDAKMKLAFEITDSFYGKTETDKAQTNFVNKFQKNALPDEMGSFSLGKIDQCLDVLIEAGLVASRSEGRSMINQKAVKLDGTVISAWDAKLQPGVLQVGKRKFVRLVK